MSRVSVSRRSFCSRPNGSSRRTARGDLGRVLQQEEQDAERDARGRRRTRRAPFTMLPAWPASRAATPPRLLESRRDDLLLGRQERQPLRAASPRRRGRAPSARRGRAAAPRRSPRPRGPRCTSAVDRDERRHDQQQQHQQRQQSGRAQRPRAAAPGRACAGARQIASTTRPADLDQERLRRSGRRGTRPAAPPP